MHDISINGVRVVPELVSTLGEADTLMMLHVSHAKQQGFTKFLIQTTDTDVFKKSETQYPLKRVLKTRSEL